MRNHDLVFLKHFSQVIAVLFGIMVGLILLALWFNGRKEHEPNRIAENRTIERIQPIGAVYAGDTGAAAAASAAKAAAEAAKGQVAYGGTLDGAVIYDNLCSACHQNGAGGAPLPNKVAWAPRIAQGLETLVKHAVEGYQGNAGIMPARGGNPALTDEQVRASVEYMVNKYK